MLFLCVIFSFEGFAVCGALTAEVDLEVKGVFGGAGCSV